MTAMQVEDRLALVQRQDDGKYTLEGLASTSGTWLNGKKIMVGQRATLCPGDEIVFGAKQGEGLAYRVKLVHASVWDQLNGGAVPEQEDTKDRERDLLPA